MSHLSAVQVWGYGKVKQSDGNLEGAIADYSRAIELDQTFEEAYQSRGQAKGIQNDYGGAITDFTRVIELNPRNAKAYHHRAFAKATLHDLDGAIADYAKAIDIAPEDSQHKTALRRLLEKMSAGDSTPRNPNAPEPPATRDEAPSIESPSRPPRKRKAGSKKSRGTEPQHNHDESRTTNDDSPSERRSSVVVPHDPEGIYGQALSRLWAGAFEDADRLFSQSISEHAQPWLPLASRSLLRRAQGRLTEAFKDAECAIQANPNSSEGYLARGIIHLSDNLLTEAMLDYQKARTLMPQDEEGHYRNLVLFLLFADTITNAQEDLRGVTLKFVATPLTRAAFALIDFAPDLALKQVTELPNSAPAVLARALALFRTEAYADAADAFTRVADTLSSLKHRFSVRKLLAECNIRAPRSPMDAGSPPRSEQAPKQQSPQNNRNEPTRKGIVDIDTATARAQKLLDGYTTRHEAFEAFLAIAVEHERRNELERALRSYQNARLAVKLESAQALDVCERIFSLSFKMDSASHLFSSGTSLIFTYLTAAKDDPSKQQQCASQIGPTYLRMVKFCAQNPRYVDSLAGALFKPLDEVLNEVWRENRYLLNLIAEMFCSSHDGVEFQLILQHLDEDRHSSPKLKKHLRTLVEHRVARAIKEGDAIDPGSRATSSAPVVPKTDPLKSRLTDELAPAARTTPARPSGRKSQAIPSDTHRGPAMTSQVASTGTLITIHRTGFPEEQEFDSSALSQFMDHNGGWWSWSEFEGGWYDLYDKGYRTREPWDSPEFMIRVLHDHGWGNPDIAGFYNEVKYSGIEEATAFIRRIIKGSKERLLRRGQIVSAQLLGYSGPASPKHTFVIGENNDELIPCGSHGKPFRFKSGKADVLVLRGHCDDVNGVAISSDGQRVLSSSKDRTMRLWNLETGKEERKFDLASQYIELLAFLPDRRHAITAGASVPAQVWDCETGVELLSLKANGPAIDHMCVSRDGRQVLTADYDRMIYSWDLTTGKQVHKFSGFFGRSHKEPIRSISLSYDGTRAVSCAGDVVTLWEVTSGKKLHTWKGLAQSPNQVCFSPDGKTIVATEWNGTLVCWDVRTGTSVESPQLKCGNCSEKSTGELEGRMLALSEDGTRVALAGKDGALHIFDLKTKAQLYCNSGHGGENRIAISADGHQVICSDGWTVRVYVL